MNEFYTGSSSPWHTVNIPIDVANPFEDARRVHIRVEGLPAGWKANIDRRWVDLAGKGRKLLQLAVTPKADAPQCTTATLNVYGAMLIDDHIQAYGGITPVIHLAKRPYFKGNDCAAPTEGNAIPLGPTGGQDGNGGDGDGGNGGNGGNDDGGNGVTGERGELEMGVFTGGSWPLGRTSSTLDPGFLFGIDLLMRWNAQWRFGAQAAYHQFADITHLSAIAVLQQPWGPYRVFVEGGPGWYAFNGSAHVGVQLGAGVELPVTSNVYLFTGATAHAVSGGTPSDRRWLDAYLGFRFRLP